MNPGAFALNPHAPSYVPLSERVDFTDMDVLVFANTDTHIVQGKHISFARAEVSSEMAYKEIMDDDLDLEMDIDMDIEYLLMTFSGLSQESIGDVYLANNGDIEATIEMLNQLEIFSIEAQENLPEPFDDGDIFESGPSTSKASKPKNTATEVAVALSSSSSSSSVIPNAPVFA